MTTEQNKVDAELLEQLIKHLKAAVPSPYTENLEAFYEDWKRLKIIEQAIPTCNRATDKVLKELQSENASLMLCVERMKRALESLHPCLPVGAELGSQEAQAIYADALASTPSECKGLVDEVVHFLKTAEFDCGDPSYMNEKAAALLSKLGVSK